MSLDIRAAYYCAAEVVRARQRNGVPIPEWLHRHFDQLDTEIRRPSLSRSGQPFQRDVEQLRQSGYTSPSLISASDAAHIMDISKRAVLRMASELDGQLIGGRWLFEREKVEKIDMERKQQHG